jgi:hypothetical protein
MEQRIYSALYPLVRDFSDAPLSFDIAKACVLLKESEVLSVFDNMIKTGPLEKKYNYTSNVYKLTPKGM